MNPKIAAGVVRRPKGSRGRRPPLWGDLNFRAIADAIGISSTFVGRIMNGRARPGIETAQKLAKHLGWSIEQVAALYGRMGKKFPYRKAAAADSAGGKSDGESVKRTGRRAEKRTVRKTDAAPGKHPADKLKPKRKARPAAA